MTVNKVNIFPIFNIIDVAWGSIALDIRDKRYDAAIGIEAKPRAV